MNKTDYIKLIKEELADLDGAVGAVQDIRTETVYDEVKNRYMLITTGTDDGIPVFEVDVSIKITDEEKILIEHNLTEFNFKKELLAKGVPSTAFQD
jgi:hypothetical protein